MPENPRPEGPESTLTENAASPFHAEPKQIRQTHRWLSMAFTLAVIVNIIAIAQKKYTNS